jgi:hypothetical protein
VISHRRKLIFAAAIVSSAAGVPSSGAQAQSLTSLNGITLSGSAPTGFTAQPFEYNCTAGQALCWPQIQLWDGATQATVNSSDHGLNIHIAGGSSGLPTGAATAANQEVTSAGTSATSAQAVQGVTGGVPMPTVGANTGGSLTSIIQAGASVPINISTATTTQLLAAATGKAIYVTAWDVIAAGTGNITLEYGTGSNCGTGTTTLTGVYSLAAQFGIAKGNGLGPVLIVPTSNALCALTSAAVQMSGSVSYTQF